MSVFLFEWNPSFGLEKELAFKQREESISNQTRVVEAIKKEVINMNKSCVRE